MKFALRRCQLILAQYCDIGMLLDSLASGRLELPDRKRRSTGEPEPGADLAKAAAQSRAVPLAGAQIDIRIRALAITVVQPVLPRQHREVQNATTQPRKIRNRSADPPVVKILQDVVAYDEVEGRLRTIRLH